MTALLVLSLVLIAITACQRPTERVIIAAETEPTPADPAPVPLPRMEVKAPPTKVGPAPKPPVPWLSVARMPAGTDNITANGVFDTARNKISVNIEGVDEFSIDIHRLPIDWDRLVVLSINGDNSELRYRDYSPILFRRDRYGRWKVVEPPTQ